MRRTLLLAIFMLIIMGIPSCTEDEFFEPATVDLKIKMTNTEPFEGQGGPPYEEDELEFEQGQLMLSSITFDGDRENDDNHYFTRDFSNPLVANLDEESLNQSVTFDIPQGRYKRIRLTLETAGADTCSGLEFRGMWEFETGFKKASEEAETDGIPVELCFFERSEPIEITLKTSGGEEQILFNQDKWERIEISIDLGFMFRNLNSGHFRQAEIHGTGNKRKIIISSQHNSKLYYNLVERVEKSMKAVIK